MYPEEKRRLMAPTFPSLPQQSCKSLQSFCTASPSPQVTLRALLASWGRTQPSFRSLLLKKSSIFCVLLLLPATPCAPVIFSLQGATTPARRCSDLFGIFLCFLVLTKIGCWYSSSQHFQYLSEQDCLKRTDGSVLSSPQRWWSIVQLAFNNSITLLPSFAYRAHAQKDSSRQPHLMFIGLGTCSRVSKEVDNCFVFGQVKTR